MDEKDRKLTTVLILVCLLTIVMIFVVVLWPHETFEAVVDDRTDATSLTTSQTTLPLVMQININTADVDALMELPGMTHQVAVNIVQYRFDHREFLTVEEVREVDGVTWELFTSWSYYIFV